MYNDRRLLSSQHLKKKSNQRRKLKNFSEILANRSNSKILSDQFKEKNIKQLLSLLNHWFIKQTLNRYHRYVKHFADKNSCLSLSTATARFTSGTRQHKICRFGKKIEDCKSFSYKTKMKFLVLLMVLISRGDGLMFNLEANSRKCLKEEIHKGVLVTGDYDISSHPGQVRKFSIDQWPIDLSTNLTRIVQKIN